MKMDGTYISIIIVVILLVGIFSLTHYADTQILEIKEGLGGSICDQEYNMDYESYDNGVLKCKPKEVKAEVQYDGIVIQIGDER